jgi:hypothetical protein
MACPDLGFHGGNLRAAAVDSCGLLVALFGDLLKRAAVALQSRLPARQPLPTFHNHIHVLWIQLDAVSVSQHKHVDVRILNAVARRQRHRPPDSDVSNDAQTQQEIAAAIETEDRKT